MDKKEAYELYIKLSNECAKHSDCYTCPFVSHEDSEEICLLDKVNVLKFVNRVLTLLDKQDQRASIPSEKDGRIIISGHVEETPEEKLSAALDKAGSIIAQGINNTKEDSPMQKNIFVPSVNAKHDNVNSPKHYLKGGLECIQVIKAQLTPEQYKGYLYGNVLKYMWRWPDKNGLEDLRKAKHYLEWLQEEVKKNG